MNRLEHGWPEIAKAFAALSSDRQREIAIRAATIALETVDQLTPDGDEEAVRSEIERLDAIAWDAQDDDTAAPGAYNIAFRRARAVNAYALARFGGGPAEAVYEALHALNAPAEAAFVLDL